MADGSARERNRLGGGAGRARPGGEAPRDARLRSADEAIARAIRHGRAATREALAAAGALLDAGLGLGSGPGAGLARLQPARLAEEVLSAVSRLGDGERRGLVDALARAVDSEVARWETRALGDPQARSVLRTFLAAREILWELGVRRRGLEAQPAAEERREHAEEAPRRPALHRVR